MRKQKKLDFLISGVLLALNLCLTVQVVQAADIWECDIVSSEAGAALAEIVQERDIMALVYLSDEYPIRVSPSYDSAEIKTVPSGQMVNILDVQINEQQEVWVYVRLGTDADEMYGYVPRINLACSDSRFLGWEKQYGVGANTPMTYSVPGAESYADIDQFPESYRPALLELKKAHPSWTFAKFTTNLDWDTVIEKELQGGRSLVYKTFAEWAKDETYDNTGNWYYATKDILKIYMDPRNQLTEDVIFQFELLTYNAEYHTREAVELFLNNTFMKSSSPAPGTNQTYAEIFWSVGSDSGVSPFHLAARVLQEQGQGNSPLISGTYSSFEGYYNYFNIGASGTDEQVIINGLQYAKDHGWDSVYKAIAGGCDFISANYIKKQQDTLYLQKFNVNPQSPYGPFQHQYMQNISAPNSEAKSIRTLYAKAEALDNTFVFQIPVYENMPAEPCGEPVPTTDIILELPTGYTENVVWLDGVPYQGLLQDGLLVVKAADAAAKTAVVYQYNETGIPVNMYVWTLRYNGAAYKATPQPELENLLTYHGFSIRITGKSGIRFKTGISTDLRNQLTTARVNGYVLKEYGTLVMNHANREQYPMVMGGEKVLEGMAYGVDDSGELQDVIYETIDGRYRYTSVLVGMPPTQYKTEYAFRGYAVMEKDGQQIIIYGPAVAKSIYSLAQQLLANGSYLPESSAYEFLQQLVSDADQYAP